MTDGGGGALLDIGRKTRTVPPSIRRALHARDEHCQFPGCTARMCDAHHVQHWIDGGVTSVGNLVLLCRRHHRLVHEGGYLLTRNDDGTTTVRRLDGHELEPVPAPPRRLTLRWDTDRIPVWDGAPFELGYAVDVLFQPAKRTNEHFLHGTMRRAVVESFTVAGGGGGGEAALHRTTPPSTQSWPASPRPQTPSECVLLHQPSEADIVRMSAVDVRWC